MVSREKLSLLSGSVTNFSLLSHDVFIIKRKAKKTIAAARSEISICFMVITLDNLELIVKPEAR